MGIFEGRSVCTTESVMNLSLKSVDRTVPYGDMRYSRRYTYSTPYSYARYASVGPLPDSTRVGGADRPPTPSASINIMSAYKGRPTIHIVWRVPAADEKIVDDYWKSHEAWMQKSHAMGLEGDDTAAPRLLKFYIAKGKELNNPLDASSGETGNLLYIMSEVYAAPEGIASHMAKGGEEWPGMKELGGMVEKYGVFMEAGACSVFTNLGAKMK